MQGKRRNLQVKQAASYVWNVDTLASLSSRWYSDGFPVWQQSYGEFLSQMWRLNLKGFSVLLANLGEFIFHVSAPCG